jgi:hypothetical protein
LVEPQNQDRRLDGWRWDSGALRSFDASGHVAGSRVCVGRTLTAAKARLCDEGE